MSAVLLLLAISNASAFTLNTRMTLADRSPTRSSRPNLGLFDFFKESEDQKAAKDAAWKAQQEMLERRRNPELMAEYNREVEERRRAETERDAELKNLQKTGDFEAWQRLREEGKVQGVDETERDADSSRLGSEGLIAERIDEKLPFIDSGYVDGSQPDVMGFLGNMFGSSKPIETNDE